MEWLSVRALSVVLAVVLVSGCFVEKDPGTVGTDDAGEAGAAATGTTGSASEATNSAGGKAGSTGSAATGAAPVLGDLSLNLTGLEAVFTITASDADNDTVTFVLDFGDNTTANGTLAPANATAADAPASLVAEVPHTYAAAGEYNATLTLSDGTSTVNATLAVSVTGGAAAVPMEPISMSGSCTMPNSGFHEFEVLPGQAFIHGVLDPGLTAIDLDWTIFDPSGSEKDSGGDFDPIDGGESDLDVQAPVAGLWSIEVNCFAGAAASYDFTLTFA